LLYRVFWVPQSTAARLGAIDHAAAE
jgi:hypothetical protein